MCDKSRVKDIFPFLSQCNTLTSGQTLPEIIHKAIVLIEDPAYWCGNHLACILTYVQTSSGIPYVIDTPCRINDQRATCLNVEGAVARACNNMGIVPPFLVHALDQWTLEYLRINGFNCDEEAGAWNPYTIGWFGEYYSHDEAMNLLRYIYGKVS